MRSFTYSIHIDRDPQAVWAYMMDFSQAPRWRNLVRRIDVLTPGPLRVGSELRITVDVQGRQKQATSEIWAFEPARRFGMRNTEQNVTGVFGYTLEPDGSGTKMTFTCDIHPHGLMWLLLPLLLRGNRARYTQQLPNLKHELERES
ncbi:MAG TPA: SRPBCC family protein [Vicinamibacterales bacterium]|nr:SRPBCC family protein [Vicinamibacterales bacterium]